jgi:hypothetical protein
MQSLIGVGHPKLVVRMADTTGYRESQMYGSVLLWGGAYSQRIPAVWVELYEMTENSGKQRTLDRVLAATEVVIQPQEMREFPFVVSVPADASLSVRKKQANIHASARIPSILPIQNGQQVYITHQKEILSIQNALIALGFSISENVLEALGFGSETTTHYAPPVHLQQEIVGASLQLSALRDWIEGRLTLTLRQHSFSEQVKAMLVGSNRVEFALTFPRDRLLDEHGQPACTFAYTSFQEMLDKVLEKPDPNSKILLRPASAPETRSDELLRPASSSRTPPDQLLRPTSPVPPDERTR